jgi:RNase H-fold protein (predicted Holliday junction resolvase)
MADRPALLGSRILGVDVGKKRVGISISDSNAKVATPHSILDRKSALIQIKKIIDDYSINFVVVGIPLFGNNSIMMEASLIQQLATDGLELNSENYYKVKELLASAKDKKLNSLEDAVSFSIELIDNCPIRLYLHDEKFTTKIVQSAARSQNISAKKQSGKLDDLAATVMLQGFLDSLEVET